MKDIKLEAVKKWRAEFEANPQNKIKQRAANNVRLDHLVRDPAVVAGATDKFAVEIDLGKIDDQQRSGRGWLFAATALAERKISEKIHDKKFRASKVYPYFFSMLEQCHTFYRRVLEMKDKPLSERRMMKVLETPVQDGGYWNGAIGIIKKYGVVPAEAMPEAGASKFSDHMNTILCEKLRVEVPELRAATDPEKFIAEKMEENYRILAEMLGTPPSEFTYSYIKDKDDAKNDEKKDEKKKDWLKEWAQIESTPTEFAHENLAELDDYAVLEFQLSPFAEKWNQRYAEDLSDNIYGDLYTPAAVKMSAEIKAAMVEQLRSGEPIWLVWDAGALAASPTKGVMDTNLFKYREWFGLDYERPAAETARKLYATEGNHATTIIGVDFAADGATPTKWKVRNSWGDKDLGHGGNLVMNDNFMDHFVTAVVVNKKYLPTSALEALETEPIFVEDWADGAA
jgi:bleomycin hydrolase